MKIHELAELLYEQVHQGRGLDDVYVRLDSRGTICPAMLDWMDRRAWPVTEMSESVEEVDDGDGFVIPRATPQQVTLPPEIVMPTCPLAT